MSSVKGPPSLRAEQAAQTRQRILDAAEQVFEEQGFAGTRIEDVAVRARVAVPTVYKIFVNKANLLVGAVNRAIAGGNAAVDQQAWFTEQLDEADPARQLHLIARNARRMYERAGHLVNVLRGDAYIDSDAVFAVRDSLIIDYAEAADGGLEVEFNFALKGVS